MGGGLANFVGNPSLVSEIDRRSGFGPCMQDTRSEDFTGFVGHSAMGSSSDTNSRVSDSGLMTNPLPERYMSCLRPRGQNPLLAVGWVFFQLLVGFEPCCFAPSGREVLASQPEGETKETPMSCSFSQEAAFSFEELAQCPARVSRSGRFTEGFTICLQAEILPIY